MVKIITFFNVIWGWKKYRRQNHSHILHNARHASSVKVFGRIDLLCNFWKAIFCHHQAVLWAMQSRTPSVYITARAATDIIIDETSKLGMMMTASCRSNRRQRQMIVKARSEAVWWQIRSYRTQQQKLRQTSSKQPRTTHNETKNWNWKRKKLQLLQSDACNRRRNCCKANQKRERERI